MHDRSEGRGISGVVTDGLDRGALVALIGRMMRAEALTDAPPETERADWLHGAMDMSEPDAQGWMGPVGPKMWVPKALCFWHAALSGGDEVSPTLMAHPLHSLARWPGIERAVQAYMALSADCDTMRTE